MAVKQYKIEGKIIDENSNILPGIEISMLTFGSNKLSSTKSDKDGEYILNIILLIDENKTSLEKPSLHFSDPSGKYSNNSLIPFTKDNQLIEFPSPVKMTTKKKDLDEKKASYKQLSSSTLKKATSMLPKSPEQVLINFIKQQVKILLNTLLPVILTLLTAFALDQVTKLLKNGSQSCPRQNKLNELVKIRNKIVEQLNSISKTLDILIKAVGIVTGLLGVLQVAINTILLLPVPAAVIPVGVITTSSSIVEGLKKLTSKFTAVGVTVLMALLIMKSVIAVLLGLLKLLDSLLLFCDSSTSLIPLSDELLLIQGEIDNGNLENDLDGSKLTRNINGFILEIQTLEINQVGSLKRRQAVAKNSQGIIILTGEQSFSADSKILLDELEFYIKSNNLKAQ